MIGVLDNDQLTYPMYLKLKFLQNYSNQSYPNLIHNTCLLNLDRPTVDECVQNSSLRLFLLVWIVLTQIWIQFQQLI